MAIVLELVLYAFMLCLLVRAVFSWIEPVSAYQGPKNRIHRLAFDVTEPVLRPVRRLVPPIGAFDISFLLVFIGVWLVLSLVQRSF